MFGKPRRERLEKYRIRCERKVQQTRKRLEKRASSPLHRLKTKRFLERMQRISEQGARHYYMTRGPLVFLMVSVLLVAAIYAMDGSLTQLMRPPVATIELAALLLGTWVVTRIGWQLMKPWQTSSTEL